MAVGSGLGSQLGFSTESTWGTRVVPSKFLRAKSHNLTPEANRVQGDGIQSGVLGQLGAHYVETTQAGSGSVSFDVPPVGIGQLLQAIMGGTSTCVQQAATTAWLQTHTLGDALKSLTVQAGVPYRGGTVYCEELTGAKISSAEFSCEVGGILGATLNFDAKKYDDTQSLAAASYVAQPALPVFQGKHLTVKTGTFGSETAVNSMIRSVDFTITNPMDTEDYTAGGGGLKSEQVRNAPVTISGTISVDWVTGAKTTFQDLAMGNTPTSLVFSWTGPIIASTHAWDLTFKFPGTFFNLAAPAISGPDVVTVDYSFEWKFDGANLPVATLMSTDIAL